MKTGQAALEFLMTYGWAIFMVLAAVGVLMYFNVIDVSKFTPETCMGDTAITCLGKPSYEGNKMSVTLINNLASAMKVNTAGQIPSGCSAMNVCNYGVTTCTDTERTVQPSQEFVLVVTCPSESKFGKGLSVKYTDTSTDLESSFSLKVNARNKATTTGGGGSCSNGQTRPCGTDVGECEFGTETCTSGSWGTCTGGVGPVSEICDGKDNDCDGVNDNGVGVTYYGDSDIDGYGNPGKSQLSCSQPPGYVPDGSDCDDRDPNINPGAKEVCDGVDNNCDSVIDEGCGGDPLGISPPVFYDRESGTFNINMINTARNAMVINTGYIDYTDARGNPTRQIVGETPVDPGSSTVSFRIEAEADFNVPIDVYFEYRDKDTSEEYTLTQSGIPLQ